VTGPTGPTPPPRDQPARTGALTGLIGAGAGGRTFVDHTGIAVALHRPVRRTVAAHPDVASALLAVGATLVGTCDAARLDGPAPDELADLGPAGRPDPDMVAALRPDAIVTAVRGRAYVLAGRDLMAALRRTAPVIGIDPTRTLAAAADLRALIGAVQVERPTPPRPRPTVPPRGAPPVPPPAAARPDLG
jgi:ABC-type Fe3+-hydroxamate transport system substrate-binding protein